MNDAELKELYDNAITVYHIDISFTMNQLVISAKRNEAVYAAMTDAGRKGVDEIFNAMVDAGTAHAIADVDKRTGDTWPEEIH